LTHLRCAGNTLRRFLLQPDGARDRARQLPESYGMAWEFQHGVVVASSGKTSIIDLPA
jgi:hypothetical protein